MEEHNDESKPEEHKHVKEKKSRFPIKLSRRDMISVMILLIFVILVTVPTLAPKGECEVARPGYKCESLKNVMVEHCQYWGEYDCDTASDVSLVQVEWYIQNLCNLQNQEHGTGLDCSNLRNACNEIAESLLCS